MSTPMKFRLIIPIYNVEEYIEHCINSIVSQGYDNLECLFINDCSTDNSQLIIDEFLNNYKGKIIFKTIYHSQNKGLSAARNTGIKNATGDYFLFLDSDDMLLPSALNNFIELAQKYNYPEIIIGDLFSESDYYQSILGFPSNKIYPDYTASTSWLAENFLLNVKVVAWSKLYKKEFIIENNLKFEEGFLFEDVIWHFCLNKFVKNVGFCFEPFYYYRFNENSIMNSTQKERGRIEGNVKLIHKLLEKVSKKNFYIEHLFILKLWHRFKLMEVSTENQTYFEKTFKEENQKIIENFEIPFLIKLMYMWLKRSKAKIKASDFLWNKSLGILYRLSKIML
ncbi:glycosyltransferase family 2 protein [Sphingobacterium sp. HJSM2_6]